MCGKLFQSLTAHAKKWFSRGVVVSCWYYIISSGWLCKVEERKQVIRFLGRDYFVEKNRFRFFWIFLLNCLLF